MIYTVTLNPALDKTYIVDELNFDSVNRATSSFEDVGGKGLNVSKVLKEFNCDSEALVVLAGHTGELIQKKLIESQIVSKAFWTEGETRINAKIVDVKSHSNTDVNEGGPDISESLLEEIIDYLAQAVHKGDIVVLAGSVQSSVPSDIYARYIGRLSGLGVKVLLDTSGKPFEEGIMSAPYLIKPNRHEAEEHLGRSLQSDEDLKAAAQEYLNLGVELVCISDGSRGAYFFTQGDSLFVPPLPVEVKSTVGAGDSMVAGLSYMLDQNMSLEEGAKLACALGITAVATDGTAVPNHSDVMTRVEQLSVSHI